MSFQPKSAAIVRGQYAWSQAAPHPALARWVSSYWTLSTGPGPHEVRTLPDACVDLTLRLGGAPRAFVAGPQARAKTWRSRGRTELVGARLMPGAATLLGVDVEALRVGWTPLEDFVPKAAVARLVRDVMRGASLAERAHALDAFLSERLLNRELDPRLSAALRVVFAGAGRVSVAKLARASGASTRTLARLFDRCIGLSPKRFARIVRFQGALRALPGSDNWARVALELGYHDQAHFVRDVRELFGATPGAVVGLASHTQ
jgi:AraC-like DNA-binding protein